MGRGTDLSRPQPTAKLNKKIMTQVTVKIDKKEYHSACEIP